MPTRLDSTRPEPDPAFDTVSENTGWNVADTLRAWDIVTVQVGSTPLHAPPHPVKPEPAVADAVIVTDTPGAKVALQVAPHAMPPTLEETEPEPVPASDTDSGTEPDTPAASERAKPEPATAVCRAVTEPPPAKAPVLVHV